MRRTRTCNNGTKASIPGLLPPQVACCLKCPPLSHTRSKETDGGYGLGLRVGIYVCPVTTDVVVDCLYAIPFNLLQYYGPLNTIASKL